MSKLVPLYCFHCPRHADRRVNEHTHIGCELVYYSAGAGNVLLGNEPLAFSAGTICLLHPNTPHSETWTAEGEAWCMVFTTEDRSYLPEGLYNDHSGEIFPLIEAFFREMQEARSGRDAISCGYLDLILSLMARTESRQSHQQPPPGDRLDSIYHYIQDHYTTDIAFDELAVSIGYSYDRFRHLFKAYYHVSPKQMVLEKRMALAKQLLRTSDEKIETIARTCGFNSAPQFNVIFKKYCGLTPTEYRATAQK